MHIDLTTITVFALTALSYVFGDALSAAAWCVAGSYLAAYHNNTQGYKMVLTTILIGTIAGAGVLQVVNYGTDFMHWSRLPFRPLGMLVSYAVVRKTWRDWVFAFLAKRADSLGKVIDRVLGANQ